MPHDMLVELAGAVAPHPTEVALVRPVRVRALVDLQIDRTLEGGAAVGAFVRLRGRVRELVVSPAGTIGEPLTAHLTAKRLLARVQAVVAPQRLLDGKRFLTLIARERLLPSVGAHVID